MGWRRFGATFPLVAVAIVAIYSLLCAAPFVLAREGWPASRESETPLAAVGVDCNDRALQQARINADTYKNFITTLPNTVQPDLDKIQVRRLQKRKNIVWLTAANFQTWIHAHDCTLVLITADWCALCEKFTPVFAALEKLFRTGKVALQSNTLGFGLIDFNEPGISSYWNITGTSPGTVWVVRNTPSLEMYYYNGQPDTADLLAFVNRIAKPPLIYLATEDDASSFLLQDDVVLAMLPLDQTLVKELYNATLSFSNELTFGLHYTDKDNMGVKMRNPAGEIVSTDELDRYSLIRWVARNMNKLVRKGKPGHFDHDARDKPGLFLFADISTIPFRLNNPYIQTIKMVAENLHHAMNFLYLDGREYKAFNIKLGLNGAIPSIAIIDLAKECHYLFKGNITFEEVTAFCEAVLEDRWPCFVRKKQPSLEPHLSTMREESIVRLNSDNLDDFVFGDQETTVVLLLTMPWCGYCKGFWSIYESLRNEFIEHRKVDSISFAVFDLTEGLPKSIVYKPTGVPDLLLFPAHHKDKFLRFSKNRTLANLIQFVDEHTIVCRVDSTLAPAVAPLTLDDDEMTNTKGSDDSSVDL